MDKWEWIARHDIPPDRGWELEAKWSAKCALEQEQARVEAERMSEYLPEGWENDG